MSHYMLDPKRYEKLEAQVEGKMYFVYETRRWYIKNPTNGWFELKHKKDNVPDVRAILELPILNEGLEEYVTGYVDLYFWMTSAKCNEKFYCNNVVDFINRITEK